MNTTLVVTVFATLGIFMLGTVLALVWYLGSRIEAMDTRLSKRLDQLDETVQRLREDVAVLKATS